MAESLRDLVSREVFDLPESVEKIVRIRAIKAIDPSTGDVSEISGPVDIDVYKPLTFVFTDRETGAQKTAQGYTLLVEEEDGAQVMKPWNVVAKKLIMRQHPLLESGAIFKGRWKVRGVGPAPKTVYSFDPVPE